MEAYWKYLVYVLKHKWHVFWQCVKLGIPWLGLVHDLGKFSPTEFGKTALYYKGTPEQSDSVAGSYQYAWLHHQKYKHHWEYWVVRIPTPRLLPIIISDIEACLPIPDRYRREMLADWRDPGFPVDDATWYRTQRHKMLLHPETRAWFELQFEGR